MATEDKYKYPCPVCLKKFTRAFTLQNHLNSHNNKRPYSCTYCLKTFTRNHDRRVHEKEIHSPCPASYPCRITLENGEVWGCVKTFSSNRSLCRHLRSSGGNECRPRLLSNLDPTITEPSYMAEPSQEFLPVDTSPIAPSVAEVVLAKNPPSAYWDQLYVNRVPSFTKLILNHSESVHNTEVILFHIRDYFQWHFQQRDSSGSRNSPSVNVPSRHIDSHVEKNAYDLTGTLTHAVDQLVKKVPQQPWGLLEKACEMARAVFRQQEQDLIRVLLLLFADQRWRDFSILWRHLLEYLASVADQVLGISHPLTVILRLLPTCNTLINSTEPALELMLGMVIECPDSTPSDICRYQWALSDLLRTQQKFSAAADICQNMIRESSKTNGYNHKTTRISMRRLGHIYFEQGRYDEAENALLNALSFGISEHGPEQPDICDIYASDRLAFVYLAKAQYSLCEYYWRQALKWTQKRWPGDDLNSMAFSQELDNVLALKHKHDTQTQE